MTTPDTTGLPELPEPRVPNTHLPWPECYAKGSYSADQMLAYARAAVAAERDACALAADEVRQEATMSKFINMRECTAFRSGAEAAGRAIRARAAIASDAKGST